MTHERTASDRPEIAVALLTKGYDFGRTVWAGASDAVRAARIRMLGGDAIMVRGSEGVAAFYDTERIQRHGAMPGFIQGTLFGADSVHTLDGPAHLHRKAEFLGVTYDDGEVARLVPHLEREWRDELDAWIEGGDRSAYDAAAGAIGRAMMRWAGMPGTRDAKTRWALRQAQIVDGFGVPYSPEYLLSKLNRWWSDRHASELIEAVRAGTLEAEQGTALRVWADHRDERGELLTATIAGRELQNSFRPAIAVARFVAFAAKALHDRPEWRARIAAETEQRGELVGGPLATAFAQEIRRTAPFVPMLPARAIAPVEVDGVRAGVGDRVLLDVHGTNLDPREWERADEFDPERFVGVDDYESIAAFVPQGGSDVPTTHRCPGEKIAIHALAAGIAALSDPRVRISGAGLDVNRRRFPTKPASGGVVCPVTGEGEGRRASACPVPH